MRAAAGQEEAAEAAWEALSLASRRASRDLRRAACRLWKAPFVAPLSSWRFAWRVISEAMTGSPAAMAVRALRTRVLQRDCHAVFLRCCLRERMMSFFEDLMFAK